MNSRWEGDMKAVARHKGDLAGPLVCRAKFLRFFPGGFSDPKYLKWERGYKSNAHERWAAELGRDSYRQLLVAGRYMEVAERAIAIEGRTNLLFSFEKMAIRDAVSSIQGACGFAVGLYAFLYGSGDGFNEWCGELAKLPRKKTRVLSWPVATVFPFLAMPERHVFLKPNVTRKAARVYGFDFRYTPTPAQVTYDSLLEFATTVRRDVKDLRPRDMIDIQSYLWVLGSEEYDEG
jgi:hypothetical protein